jgi:putative oxidoreductase
MDHWYEESDHLRVSTAHWLIRHSVTLLRVSLGFVFLSFGVLKFFPGASPAEGLTEETMDGLTAGLIVGRVSTILVAVLESTIGVCLLTGKFMRPSLILLGVAMIGTLSPLFLVPNELFVQHPGILAYVPTLEGQYVLKDIVLLAAGLVIAGRVLIKPSHPASRKRSSHHDETLLVTRRGSKSRR